jgi:hypothetical protein
MNVVVTLLAGNVFSASKFVVVGAPLLDLSCCGGCCCCGSGCSCCCSSIGRLFRLHFFVTLVKLLKFSDDLLKNDLELRIYVKPIPGKGYYNNGP